MDRRPLIIVIDQFEELFLHSSSDERVAFLSLLHDLVADNRARVAVALRRDRLDLLLVLLLQVDPSERVLSLSMLHMLEPFREAEARQVTEEILSEFVDGDPLRAQQMDDLAATLARDLLRPPRDKRVSQREPWTVLPAELQGVGRMLQREGPAQLSVERYRARGGREGLVRDFLEDVRSEVSQTTGVDGSIALTVLQELSPGGIRLTLAANELLKAPSLRSLDAKTLDRVLRAFERLLLVNRLPASTAEAPDKFELIHDQLAKLLHDAPDPFLVKKRNAEARLEMWLLQTRSAPTAPGRRRLRDRIATPLPLSEAVRLRRFAVTEDARRMIAEALWAFRAQLAVAVVAMLLLGSVSLSVNNSNPVQARLAEKEAIRLATLFHDDDDGATLTTLTLALAEGGSVEKALAAAALVRAPAERAAMLAIVADSLLQLGHVPAAGRVLQQALRLGHLVQNDTTGLIARMAEALGQIHPDSASALTAATKTPIARAWVLADVARGLSHLRPASARERSLTDARASALSLPDSLGRLEALVHIADVAQEINAPAELSLTAVEIDRSIQNRREKQELVRAAEVLGRAGRIEEATAAFWAASQLPGMGSINPNRVAEQELIAAIDHFARAGMLPEVLTTAARAPLDGNENYVGIVAGGIALAAGLDTALQVVRRLSSGVSRDEAVLAMASVLFQSQKIREARIALGDFKGPPSGEYLGAEGLMYSRAVELLFNAGERQRAEVVAYTLDTSGSVYANRGWNESIVGKLYLSLGMPDSALKFATIPGKRCDSLIDIGSYLLDEGDHSRGFAALEAALRQCPAYEEEHSRMGPWRVRVATEYLRTNAMQSADLRLRKIVVAGADSARAAAALRLSTAGHIAESRRLTASIRDEVERGRALEGLGIALVLQDSLPAAEAVYTNIRLAASRHTLCRAIGQRYAKWGRYRDANRVANICDSSGDRIYVLSSILRHRTAHLRRARLKSTRSA